MNLDKAVKEAYQKDATDSSFTLALSSTEETYTLGFMRGVDYAAALLKLQTETAPTLNRQEPIKIVLDEENIKTLHY